MMEYTKGPWEINENTVYGLPTFEISSETSDSWIANVLDKNMPGKANAQLIASAPMMYEALKEIQACKGNPKMLEGMIIMSHIEQALAKAEGK